MRSLTIALAFAGVLTCATQEDGTFTGRCQPGRYKVTIVAIPRGGGGGDPGSLATPGKAPANIPSAYTSPRVFQSHNAAAVGLPRCRKIRSAAARPRSRPSLAHTCSTMCRRTCRWTSR